MVVLVVIDADNDTAKTHAGRENEGEEEDEEEEEEDDDDTTDDRVILKAVVTHSHRFSNHLGFRMCRRTPRRNHDLAYQHVEFVASGF